MLKVFFYTLHHCQEAETIEHILLLCRKFTHGRQKMMTQWIEVNIKSILQYGDSVQGRKCFFVLFFKNDWPGETLLANEGE